LGSCRAGNGEFNTPIGMAVHAGGTIIIADTFSHRIQLFGGPWLDFFIGEPEPPLGR